MMANPHMDDVRKSHGDKLGNMVGDRGEHASERAERIASTINPNAQPARGHEPEEQWIAAPARQVSNLGNVRK